MRLGHCVQCGHPATEGLNPDGNPFVTCAKCREKHYARRREAARDARPRKSAAMKAVHAKRALKSGDPMRPEESAKDRAVRRARERRAAWTPEYRAGQNARRAANRTPKTGNG